MTIELDLQAPLGAAWTPQYVKIPVPGLSPSGVPQLSIDDVPTPVQLTGRRRGEDPEVMLKLGFAAGQTKRLVFDTAPTGCLFEPAVMDLTGGVSIGVEGRQLHLADPAVGRRQTRLRQGQHEVEMATVPGPFAGLADWPMAGSICCEAAFVSAQLTRLADGPICRDYELVYRFAGGRQYRLHLRCYQDDPWIEVSERYELQMNAEMIWTLNPQLDFDSILSRDSFEGESQPTVEPLGVPHPSDVLCRLQMPVLSEYFIPNNRGWFAFFDSRCEARGMVGILGLYGGRWQEPVAGMPEVLDREGTVAWQASLASGARHWLLYAGPVEKAYSAERRLVFHRLHAEFNALRLDEHLDLTGATVWDRPDADGMFVGPQYHEDARRRCAKLPPLSRTVAGFEAYAASHGGSQSCVLQCLLEPTPANHQALHQWLVTRFEKWVRQFQGFRRGENDYQKNVIGFSRWLRGMLLAYEMLARDGCLDAAARGRLNAWFVFAARRIVDAGRWPHARTMLHPDHPESTRDLYTYGGEHKPDRLFWTNSLPNFQSDPMCALAHLAALFPEHPDADDWLRFALDDIDRQLDAYCGDSGAWEESINYALYTMSYFVITFRVLKRRLGIDYFQDPRLRRYAGWLCRFFGPRDRRWGEYTWPAIGNSVLPQGGSEALLALAGELATDDPLRHDCLAVYQAQAGFLQLHEHYPVVLAAMAPIADRQYAIRPLTSEVMDEVGVALRHDHTDMNESYLFQKIGFAKDHYEGDESAFNWYAKGIPLCMDYGTYSGDVATFAAHNLVEIPDLDPLRRGYLAGHLFTSPLDYTHCEMPVTLKLSWGRVRSFAEVDNADGRIDRGQVPYFYIGDRNPVGPKTWKSRRLLFVKPDYVVLFDRVFGDVPHRWNLHVVGDDLRRDGQLLAARGRFDLDLQCLIQHPAEFHDETGELVPQREAGAAHAQRFWRLYNQHDGIYRAALFAQERERPVSLAAVGRTGMRIATPDYTDYVFIGDEVIVEDTGEVQFRGRTGWLRLLPDGRLQACMIDGERLAAAGQVLAGRGPWAYNFDNDGAMRVLGGPPRQLSCRTSD